MKLQPRLFLLAVLLLLLAGCPYFMMTGGVQKYKKANFSVDLPVGWMRSARAPFLIMSKDGLPCQLILAKRLSLKKDLKDLPKPYKPGMLPHEQAEIYLDSQKMDKKLLNFEVEESAPAEISGQQGFRAVYHYNLASGLAVKDAVYGFLQDDFLYIIMYEAPTRHYFDRDLDAFEQVTQSFRLLK